MERRETRRLRCKRGNCWLAKSSDKGAGEPVLIIPLDMTSVLTAGQAMLATSNQRDPGPARRLVRSAKRNRLGSDGRWTGVGTLRDDHDGGEGR